MTAVLADRRPVLEADGTPVQRPAAKGFLAGLERRLAFAVPLAASLPVAWVLVLRYHSIYNDAQSRLANAYYMLYSKDPHAAAIGFVWNPLPSLVDLPLLLFKNLWPALSEDAFAANIMSCLFFALACYQLFRFFEDLQLNTGARWGLWLCFAANPLVFFYAVNGMSEILFLCILIIATRFLVDWLRTDRTGSLVIAGVGLAVAYLARNEAVAPAIASGVLVVVVSYLRSAETGRKRRQAAITDGALVTMPFALSFAAWAATSWIIVGQPFAQFSSSDGNSALVATAGTNLIETTVGGRLHYAIDGAFSVAPLLVLVAGWALYRTLRARDATPLVPIAMIASVLVLEMFLYTEHQLFPWYRYYIYACPAVVMTAATLVHSRRSATPALWTSRRDPRPDLGAPISRFPAASWAAVTTAAALLCCLPGAVTTATTLGSAGKLASSDRYQLAYFLWPRAKGTSFDLPDQYPRLEALAHQLDALKLPAGAVLLDNANNCIPHLILDSRRPSQFAIPNDVDYLELFGVPYQFGVRYMLVPDPTYAPNDQLDVRFPGLYDDGQGMATLVEQLDIPGCPDLRLYKVNPTAD